MKSLLVRLVVVLIGLAIFGNAEVWGADWKLYFVDENFLAYYDAQSINHQSKNVVRVWVRMSFTEKGVIDCVGELGKKYENVSHARNLAEINCLEKTFRFLSMTFYDNKGGVIHSPSSPSKWDFIPPESQGDDLYKEVCK